MARKRTKAPVCVFLPAGTPHHDVTAHPVGTVQETTGAGGLMLHEINRLSCPMLGVNHTGCTKDGRWIAFDLALVKTK